LDIRYCNLIKDLSKFHKIPKIVISGIFNQDFCKLPNVKVICNSYKKWIGTTQEHKLSAARTVQYSPMGMNIPSGGWCHPLYSKNNNDVTEDELIYMICIYHDKIHERVCEISYKFANMNIKHHKQSVKTVAGAIKKHIMKYFIGFGPGDIVIRDLFNLNKDIKEMYQSYIDGQFNDMIRMEIENS